MINDFYLQVVARPEQTALSIDGCSLTYFGLWQQAVASTRYLKQHGVQQGQIIGLHLAKSNQLVVMQLACWLAGAAFMPLPIDWPIKRKQQALDYSQAVGIITEMNISDLTDNINQWLTVNIISEYSRVDDCEIFKHNSHHNRSCVNKKLKNNYYPESQPTDLAYVIFTSGSSGEPKGVLVTFAGLPTVINQQIRFTRLKPGERCLWLHHPGFDASIADIWVALLAGATLIADNHLQSANLLQFIAVNKINYVDLPAALLPMLEINLAPDCLHTVLVGGEVCDLMALCRWGKLKRLVVSYGPTEATICSSMYLVTGYETVANWIGQPLNHLQYWVVDNQLQPVLSGEPGELIITGPGVAAGYLNGNTNNIRFVQFQGQVGYRTGDRVRQVDQNYQFLGRLDRQFKLHGKLICPEEIEQALLHHTEVKEAYIFKFKQQLIAAIAPELDSQLLQTRLLKSLPCWMKPQQWLCLPKLPRNQHQKISQAQLIHDYEQRNFVASTCPVLTLIRQVLQQTAIDFEDDLKAWSPSSIQWLALLMGLKQLGMEITYEQLFAFKSIKEIVKRFETYKDNNRCYLSESSNSLSSEKLNQALLQYPPLISLTKNTRHNAVLLTGATGLLGAELLELLSQHERTIYCLVRGAKTRLYQHCQKWGVTVNWDQVVVLAGDIRQSYLNLSESEWKMLADQVSDIYHCAADTNLLKNNQQLQATNVTGSYHVLQLAASGQKKRFHYASTLSLVVDSSWQYRRVDENNSLDSGQFYGGYTQSKWQAEQLIRRLISANIFRFGLLTGVVGKGRLPTKDWFNSRLLLKPDFSQIPANACVDFTPVNYAAKLMLGISQQTDVGTFHICNPNPVLASDLALIINAPKSKSVNNTCWSFEKSTNPLRLFKMTNTHIESNIAAHYAQILNLPFPVVDNNYLQLYLEFLWQH
ncbi:AMP-binding protein [Spartinivicinus poritis]|uniref:AMP-binding protein n=1 Tax=Spartinivicinus poritis TaxID=2994640 RepID=A0ABT5UCM1_9GAMM|nr:AMP-binding protein [Spartinivicinus sp. A2-2]MDE1463741.1 AMP-binding protein [Spartinivicinus sp. A2-2]